MKNIIATTAMSLLLTTAAFAETNNTAFKSYEAEQAGDIYASTFIGMRIYSAERDFDTFNAETMVETGAEKEWDDIGEINDVILGRDGDVKAVILGVGGFIGIGEKDVAVDMDSIKFVAEKDDEDDFFLVVKTSKEQLEGLPAFSRLSEAEMAEAKKPSTTDTETAQAAGEPAMTPMMAPKVEREGYMTAGAGELTTEDLTGARVYGINDEDIGEVDKLLMGDSGKLKEAILDIGGFIGLGEHRIAVSMDEIQILRDDAGNDLRVYIDASQEELEKRPEYKG